MAPLLAMFLAAAPSAAAQPPIPGISPPAEEPAAEPPPGAEEGTETGLRLFDLPVDPLSAEAWEIYARELVESAILFLPNVFRALVVLFAFWLIFRVVAGLFRRLLARRHTDASIIGITTRLSRYALLSVAVVMALGELGFNIGSLIATLGILGLAVGLAAQESLGNVIAGLTILERASARTHSQHPGI